MKSVPERRGWFAAGGAFGLETGAPGGHSRPGRSREKATGMINLLPRDTVFYDLFEAIARHVVSAAEALNRLAQKFPEVGDEIRRIREDEHAADDLAHQALHRLDSTFITPFDREDIHTLIGRLDDIIDSIDALAKRFPLFHIKSMDPIFRQQTEVLVQAARAVGEAVGRLRKSRKLSDLNDTLIEIHERESAGDDNHHAAMSRLFGGGIEPLEVMKWKELHDYLENAIDCCEDVGNTLERIVLKNG
jgi:predicted phosphate transport protein (TIGR00153 family)